MTSFMRESPYSGTVLIGFSVYLVRGVEIRLSKIRRIAQDEKHRKKKKNFKRTYVLPLGDLENLSTMQTPFISQMLHSKLSQDLLFGREIQTLVVHPL